MLPLTSSFIQYSRRVPSFVAAFSVVFRRLLRIIPHKSGNEHDRPDNLHSDQEQQRCDCFQHRTVPYRLACLLLRRRGNQRAGKYIGIKGMDTTGFKDATKFHGKHSDKQRGHSRRQAGFNERWDRMERTQQGSGMRNKRDVWAVATRPYKGAHFATFPPVLIEPCILAGVQQGGIVLDPFLGSDTTAAVAKELGRHYVGIELNPEYIALPKERISGVHKAA